MPEPLSEEKLAELEAFCGEASELEEAGRMLILVSLVSSLLAEARLGREALKALDNLLTATTTNAGADATCCAVIAAKSILRKAGRR